MLRRDAGKEACPGVAPMILEPGAGRAGRAEERPGVGLDISLGRLRHGRGPTQLSRIQHAQSAAGSDQARATISSIRSVSPGTPA